LYATEDDQGLITLTGFDHASFKWILERFGPVYYNDSPYISDDGRIVAKTDPKKGRPRLLTAEDCLGLLLTWTRTRGSQFPLQMIFGVTGSPLDVYLKFARRIMIKILLQEELAQVRMPDEETVRAYQAAIKDKHPNLDGVWCTMDGLKLYIQAPPEDEKQSMFYNGWKCDHYVVNVFVFAPDGTIPCCTINVPGSQHDSTVADWGGIYNKLEDVYLATGNGKCSVDSAFAAAGNGHSVPRDDFLIKSGVKEFPRGTEAEVRLLMQIEKESTALRQASEWGIRAFQSSFPRTKDRFKYEELGERKRMIHLFVLLFNLRARLVGINQIRNTYKYIYV